MANQNQTIIVGIFGVIIIFGFLFAPPLIASGLAGLRDMLGDFRDVLFGDGGSQADLGWFVEYEDGTEQHWNPNQSFPFTVLYEGKPIRYFGVTSWYKVESSREIHHVEGSSTINLYIDDVLHSTHTQSISAQAPQLGQWTQVFGGTISWGVYVIEEKDEGALTSHVVSGTMDLSLTIKFEDAETINLQGSASGSMTLNVVESATLDVEVRTVSTPYMVSSPLS